MIRELLRLVLASGALLVAKSALLGIRTLILLIIAAHGGVTDLASAAFALSLAEAGRWIADFGTDTWSVRAIAIARDTQSEARVVTSALLVKAVGSMLIGLVIFFICRFTIVGNGAALGCLAAVLLMTSQVAGLSISYLQAKDAIPKLAPLLIPCAATVLIAYLALSSGGALTAIAAMTVCEVVIAVLLIRVLRGHVRFLRPSWPDAARMARACVPTAAFGIVVGLYSRLDTFALAEFSLPALAAYTVAQRLFQPFQIAVTSFGSVVYSRAAVLQSRGQPVTGPLFRREIPLIVAIALICSAILFFGGDLLIRRIFPQYATALTALTFLCMILPFAAFNSAVTGVLLGHGRYWTVLAVALIDLALTYIAMIVLIPPHGGTGAAVCLLIGVLINAFGLSLATLVQRQSPTETHRPALT
jgi:O-antigen/teichoic acid export membrane protein